MKAKLLSFFLVVVLLCALVACMPTTPDTSTTTGTPAATTTAVPVTTTLKAPTTTPSPAVTTTAPLETPGDLWQDIPQ